MVDFHNPRIKRFSGFAPLVACGLCLVGVLGAGCGPSSEQAGVVPADSGAVRVASSGRWPMGGGGPELQGSVTDLAPGDPVIAWTIEAGSRIDAGAAISGGIVYFGCRSGTLFALALADGREVWRRSFEDGIGATPAVSGDSVLVGCDDGKLHALDCATGKERWHFATGMKVSAGPTVFEDPQTEEGRVLLNGYDGVARCLRAKDGMLLWSYSTDEPLNGSAAVVERRFAVFGGCDARVHVVDLQTGAGLWRAQTAGQIPSSVATIGGFGYCGNYASQVVAIRVEGGEIAWVYEDGAFPFFGTPAVNEARVYIGSRDKHLHAIDRLSGKGAWKFRAGGRVDGSPLVFRDAVVFGSSDGRLYALEHASGSVRWQIDLGSPLSSAAPAYAAGTLVIGSESGVLFALRSPGASQT